MDQLEIFALQIRLKNKVERFKRKKNPPIKSAFQSEMQRLLQTIFLLFIIQAAFSQVCTLDVNYTFTGACNTIAKPFNNSRYYSLVQSQIAKGIDNSISQTYQWLVGNRTLFLPGTPCETTYYNYMCSSLKPCYGGRIVKPCFSVCLDFYFQCSFFTYTQATNRCLNISGNGQEFAAQGDSFCEKVYSGSGVNQLSFGIMIFMFLFVFLNILNKH